jgi:hypothetical protein
MRSRNDRQTAPACGEDDRRPNRQAGPRLSANLGTRLRVRGSEYLSPLNDANGAHASDFLCQAGLVNDINDQAYVLVGGRLLFG